MNKKLLTLAVASAMATPMAAQAVKYSLSGQVNRAIVFADDGADSQVRNVDATSSGTRFRLKGSEDLGNGMNVGFYWEMQFSSNPSGSNGATSQGDGGAGGTGASLRQGNVWFGGNFGTLTIGQQSSASDGATEADLSGTGAVSVSSVTTYTSGSFWRATAPGNAAVTSGTTFYSAHDGGRLDAVRYDSPALGPITVSAAIGNDSYWDVAARAAGGLFGGSYSAALFYRDESGTDGAAGGAGTRDRETFGGSASYLFSQGTSIGGHYATRDDNNASSDADSWSVKLGHKWGPHAVSVTYANGEDFGQDAGFVGGAEHQTINVNYVHSLKKADAIIYAGFFHQWADGVRTVAGGPEISVEDINVFLIGSRVKFD